MEIHPSVRRHGIGDEGMLYAIESPLAVEDLGDELIIHAMPARPVYRRLLET